jgi:hypothetical protein
VIYRKKQRPPVTLIGKQPDLGAVGGKPTREEEAGIGRHASILPRELSGIPSVVKRKGILKARGRC